MSTEALLWLALAGLAGWNLRLQWWIVGHNRCHIEPMAATAALEARVTGCEAEGARLAANAHKMRTIEQRIILTLAAKGIMVRG